MVSRVGDQVNVSDKEKLYVYVHVYIYVHVIPNVTVAIISRSLVLILAKDCRMESLTLDVVHAVYMSNVVSYPDPHSRLRMDYITAMRG